MFLWIKIVIKFSTQYIYTEIFYHVGGIVSRVSQRIGILRLVKRIFVDTSVLLRCYFEFGSPNPRVLFSGIGVSCWMSPSAWANSVARLCPVRVTCRCVIDVVFLGLVWCTMFIRILITICAASCHLLLLEFDIPELRPQNILCSLKYQGLERSNLQGLSCRLRFDCGMTFPTQCLIPQRWMGSSVLSFPELCFLQFSVAQVLVGCESNL